MNLSNLHKKYKFTGVTKEVNGVIVHQIRVINSNNQMIGGYIESETNLSHKGNCWIYRGVDIVGDLKIEGETGVFRETLHLEQLSIDSLILFSDTLIDITIKNCPKLNSIDRIFPNLKSVKLINQKNFLIKTVPIQSRLIIEYSTLLGLPHLVKYKNLLSLYNSKYKSLEKSLESFYCKDNSSLKEQLKAMWDFQDFLIESGKYTKQECKIFDAA